MLFNRWFYSTTIYLTVLRRANGLYKAEVIHRLGTWKTMASAEWETLKWVDWFNNRLLLEPIGYIPPAEAEERYYAQFDTLDMVA